MALRLRFPCFAIVVAIVFVVFVVIFDFFEIQPVATSAAAAIVCAPPLLTFPRCRLRRDLFIRLSPELQVARRESTLRVRHHHLIRRSAGLTLASLDVASITTPHATHRLTPDAPVEKMCLRRNASSFVESVHVAELHKDASELRRGRERGGSDTAGGSRET